MSEQYRCSECGHFVEIQDDAICDVCNIGKMQHLRYIRGGDGSHWEGCADVHWDCRIAQHYYKDELYLDEDLRMLAKTYPADVSAIGVKALIDYVEALEAELAVLKSERRWIPVSERLPETNRSVLIFNELRLCQVAGHYPDGKWYLQDGAIEWQGVTHWMPLPPPPEEE